MKGAARLSRSNGVNAFSASVLPRSSPRLATQSRSLASGIRSSMICIVEMARPAPKGRNMPAQGNALGSIVKNIPSPEGTLQRLCRPFRA